MRILLLGLLFFAFQVVVYAQPIYTPFKGQKELIKIKDINNEIKYIDRIGKKCGDYFLYKKVRDQKIISFGVPVTKDESDRGVSHIQQTGISRLMIKLDDKIKVPTAEIFLEPQSDGLKKERMIIRISKNDFSASVCISKLDKM